MRKRTIIASAIAAAAGLVAIGELAASAGAPTNPEAGPLPEGVTVVTQQVYEDAFARFEACMNEGGASLAAKHDVAGVHRFSYLAEAEPVYDTCYADFAPVDFQWQLSRSYDMPEFERYRECLTEIGIEPGEDAETILAQVEVSGIDVRKCLGDDTTNG